MRRKPLPGMKTCDKCLARVKRRQARKRLLGLCICCGKHPPLRTSLCAKCLDVSRLAQRERQGSQPFSGKRGRTPLERVYTDPATEDSPPV